MTDAEVLAGAELATALRSWLRSRRESPAVQAAALTYELAALLAKDAPTREHAFELIDHWTRTMKWQIHDFGVGVEHP